MKNLTLNLVNELKANWMFYAVMVGITLGVYLVLLQTMPLTYPW